MIECKEFEVDGKRYRTTMFGAWKGSEVLLRVGKLLGPATGRAIGVVDLDLALSVDAGAGLVTLFEAADPSVVRPIMSEFVNKSEYQKPDGNWVTLDTIFDDHFAGRYLQMMAFIRGAFEVNYGDFSAALRGILKAALPEATKKTTPAPSTSPTGSTSPSTASL